MRHASDTEYFKYKDTTALRKVWNSEDDTITVTAGVSGTTCMQVDFTGSGEVWGLVPTPFDGEARTDSINDFTFKFTGNAGNSEGDIYIKLLAADGTSFIHNFSSILQLPGTTDLSFSFADFEGRKYLRAVIAGISFGSSGSGTALIDDVKPFVPAVWDEIIEDPTVIQGDIEQTPGVHACYFTTRERPRQALTSISSSAGCSNCILDVASTNDFDEGDIVVIYDFDHYEMGIVDTINSGTRMTVKHVTFDEDISAKFEYHYSTLKMAMVANNTYRVNRIGGAYVLTKDCSDWERWITDDNTKAVLEPSEDGAEWDSLSVKQPSVRFVGNDVYMAYVGCCVGKENSIGFARSSNFTTFSRLKENPYIMPGASFDNSGCNHPDLFIDMPYTMVHYAGDDGTKETIGSAIHESSFHNAHIKFHVTLLVYPCASLGEPPDDGCVLFDMGNFRIEVDGNNTLSAHAIVDGTEHSTKKDDLNNLDMKNGFGTFIVHDHWNLVIAQYTGDRIGIHRVCMMPDISAREYFTKSPWMLAAGATPGTTSVNLQRQYSTAPGVTDYEGIGQDVMFWGLCHESADYGKGYKFQVGRIVSVTEIGNDIFLCQLANPIGPWGFSNANQYDGATYMGVLLARDIR